MAYIKKLGFLKYLCFFYTSLPKGTDNEKLSQPVLGHLNELRIRLLRVSVLFLVLVIVAFVQHEKILALFTVPVVELLGNVGGQLQALSTTEVWSVASRLALLTSTVFVLPYFWLELIYFLKPGLKKNERFYLYSLPFLATTLFIAGALFAYYLAAPVMIDFLIRFGASAIDGIQIAPSLQSSVQIFISLIFWSGLIFEIPIVMLLLNLSTKVSHKWFESKRRIVVIIALIIGAVVTPTGDPISQLLIAIPVFVLYEFGIFLIKLIQDRRDGLLSLEKRQKFFYYGWYCLVEKGQLFKKQI